MGSSPRIGVVTVTYNSAEVLPDFLHSLWQQTHPDFLLFAVDNASKDATVALLRQESDPRMRIIANPDNKGVAAGNNQGIVAALEAGCDQVLLLNNDTEFEPALFVALVQGLDAYSAEMICPKMMYYDEPQRIWAAGGTFQPWFGYRTIHLGADELDRGQHQAARQITYVPTCCVLIRKVVFETIGLMDERYFVYVDDVDFMYRAMKAGLKLMYLPTAVLLHKVGRLTGGEESPFAVRYGTRNRIFFLLKHFGWLLTLPSLCVREVLWLAALLAGRSDWTRYKLKHEAMRSACALHHRGTQSAIP